MRLGLSLSGGGARGIAHVGILKALHEEEVEIAMITGASAGAIVGAFYCYGYSPDEIFGIIKSFKLFRHIRPALSKSGLLKMDTVETIYKRYFVENDFASLKIPLVISATNLNAGKTTYFSSGPLVNAIMASTAVPVIFDPVKIGDESYVDGGILDNLPVEPLMGYVDKIIGVNCNPISDNYKTGNMKSVLERSLLMAINVNSYSKRSVCDLFLEPPGLQVFGGLDFKKADAIFDVGYAYGKSIVTLVKDLKTP